MSVNDQQRRLEVLINIFKPPYRKVETYIMEQKFQQDIYEALCYYLEAVVHPETIN